MTAVTTNVTTSPIKVLILANLIDHCRHAILPNVKCFRMLAKVHQSDMFNSKKYLKCFLVATYSTKKYYFAHVLLGSVQIR